MTHSSILLHRHVVYAASPRDLPTREALRLFNDSHVRGHLFCSVTNHRIRDKMVMIKNGVVVGSPILDYTRIGRLSRNYMFVVEPSSRDVNVVKSIGVPVTREYLVR